ncbi:MAG: dihydrolipoamide acetyltransferase component of pyruvate dehydrogenase complex [Candidatus Binatia bacterium]|nr:MAG: dihydrolipoamide acetyltransferase component of pyruvate dehydrogenase complex [Candidatus Binatia bacterium]
MDNEIVMPKLSDAMEEGKILRWLKSVGDEVRVGEVIAEVETDKADMELEADREGILKEIRVREGESAKVGAVLAVLEPKGGERAPSREKPAPAGEKSTVPPRPEPKKPVEAPSTVPPRASALARKVAEERGVELEAVVGSGPQGKIVRRDVEAATGAEAARPVSEGVEGRVELSRMRQAIARRMTEAKREIPHFYVTAEIDMTETLRLLEMVKRRVGEHLRITVTHAVLKAVALALVRHPRVNGRWVDGGIVLGSEVHLGMVVALEDGLVVPVIHHCERLSLQEIAAEANRLAAAARQGKFSGDDLRGSTFAVSNLGMFDVDEFAAIIDPPHAAVLAVGAVKPRPVVRGDRLEVARTMRVTLSCDHRQLDGAEAGRFLRTLREILENPVHLVMD